MKAPKKLKQASKPIPEPTAGEGGVSPWEPTINEAHYTPQGEHPEDRIRRDKEYIRRLQTHMDEVYDALERDLAIKEGESWLFDFIHNEDQSDEFEDYLCKYGVNYSDITAHKKTEGEASLDKEGDEVVRTLRLFNKWRRGDDSLSQMEPHLIGEAIDTACEVITRLRLERCAQSEAGAKGES